MILQGAKLLGQVMAFLILSDIDVLFLCFQQDIAIKQEKAEDQK